MLMLFAVLMFRERLAGNRIEQRMDVLRMLECFEEIIRGQNASEIPVFRKKGDRLAGPANSEPTPKSRTNRCVI